MRAVRYYGKRDVRIENIPDPELKANEVLIAPAYCGICGSDMHEYIDGPIVAPVEPHPLTGETIPITLGHEFSGTVVEVGPQVTSLKIGDRVAVQGTLECGMCEPCKAGKGHACVKAGNVGQTGRGGGLAERVACEEQWCFELPEGLGLDIGALAEPFAVAEHAISLVEPPLTPNQSALVLGCGTIGLAAVSLLRARGLTTIVATDLSSKRTILALEFGASHVFSPQTDDVVVAVRKITSAQGVHAVIDCAGSRSSLNTAAEAIRHHGTIMVPAIFSEAAMLDPNLLVFKEAILRGSLSHTPDDWQNILRYFGSGKIKPSKMISRRIPLENVVDDGLKALEEGFDGLVKVLVQVNGRSEVDRL